MRKNRLLKQVECCLLTSALLVMLLGNKAMAGDFEPMVHGDDGDGYICKHGYHTFRDYYLEIGNRKTGSKPCYISEDFSTRYYKKINSAINVWNNQFEENSFDDKISLRKITDPSVAKIKFKPGYIGKGVYGVTYMYSDKGDITPEKDGVKLKSNYTSCVIQINTSLTGISKMKKTAVHELGHALGLSHRTCVKGIMYKWAVDMVKSVVPDQNAVDTVRHIYYPYSDIC